MSIQPLKVYTNIVSRKSNSVTLLSVTDAVPNSEYHLPIVNDYIWVRGITMTVVFFLFILILFTMPSDIMLIEVAILFYYYYTLVDNFFLATWCLNHFYVIFISNNFMLFPCLCIFIHPHELFC